MTWPKNPLTQRPETVGGELLSMAERKALFAIIATAEQFLSGEIALIGTAEIIARLGAQLRAVDAELLSPFAEIADESYELVIRNPALWSPSFIAERTVSREEFEARGRSEITSSCKALRVLCLQILNECPVCTFTCDGPPYNALSEPSYEKCRACGFFFDDLDTEFDWGEWRRRWIAKGMPFASPPAPIGWEPPSSFSQ